MTILPTAIASATIVVLKSSRADADAADAADAAEQRRRIVLDRSGRRAAAAAAGAGSSCSDWVEATKV